MYAAIYFLHSLPISESLFLIDEQSCQVFKNTKFNLSIWRQPIIATY